MTLADTELWILDRGQFTVISPDAAQRAQQRARDEFIALLGQYGLQPTKESEARWWPLAKVSDA